MKRNISIKLKAAFLIVVFGMNTITGFACAMGLNMGYNVHHHESHEMKQQDAMHSASMHHRDTSKPAHHHPANESSKDDCCSHSVKDLTLLSKTVPNKISIIQPVFFIAFIGAYIHADIYSYANIITNLHLFVRSHHPPIPDVRIAIQSFQI
ncbi:MAG: hypothetical protein ABI691_24200 [Ginsengibacter sp.]